MTRFLRAARAAAIATMALSALPAAAHDVTAGALSIDHPWARPNLPNRPVAVYLSIANAGEIADRLIAASAEGFETFEMHTTVKDGDIMKMHPVEAIEVPAGGSVDLAPGGYHLMLFGAADLHPEGARFPMTLTFEGAGEVAIEVVVEKRGPDTGHGMDHGATHGGAHGTGDGTGHGTGHGSTTTQQTN